MRDTGNDCSGVYTIYLRKHLHEERQPVRVFCDLEDTTAWTVSTATLLLLYLLLYIGGRYIALLLTAHFLSHQFCVCAFSRSTRDVDSMSGYCSPTVYYAERTLAQYWITVSCLKPRRAGAVGGGPTLNRYLACFSCLLGDQMTKKYRIYIDFELSYYREYDITSFFQFLLTNQIINT